MRMKICGLQHMSPMKKVIVILSHCHTEPFSNGQKGFKEHLSLMRFTNLCFLETRLWTSFRWCRCTFLSDIWVPTTSHRSRVWDLGTDFSRPTLRMTQEPGSPFLWPTAVWTTLSAFRLRSKTIRGLILLLDWNRTGSSHYSSFSTQRKECCSLNQTNLCSNLTSAV